MKIKNITSGLTSPAQWLIDWIRGPYSDTDVRVTFDSALSYSPVWYAVSRIAGHVGQIPLNLHRKLDRGSELAENNPLYRLLKHRPNELQTPIVFKETMMMHALLAGNGRAAIVRRNGVPVELITLLPDSTVTCLVEGKKWHVVIAGDDDRCGYVEGGPTKYRDGKIYKIPDEDVLHIPGLGYNGFCGVSLVDLCRNVFGLGLAAEKAVSSSFKNPRPGVIIHAPTGMLRDKEKAKEFLDFFNEYHSGVDNQGKAALLREGMTAESLPVSASDLQWLEQRKFQRQEIALLFGLESILGDDESSSYNTMEQKTLAYLSNCLMKWLRRWEEECDYKLLGRNQNRQMFYRFDTAALLRTDYMTRMNAYSTAINARIMSPNEVRSELGYNPYDGGDEFFNPAITPGGGESDMESESDDDEEPEDGDAPSDESDAISNQARLEFVENIRGLLSKEALRVRNAAKARRRYENGRATFATWQRKFYDGWKPKMAEVVGEPLAAHHCIESCRQLDALTTQITDPKTWSAAVADHVANWTERAEHLAEQWEKARC